MTIPWSGWLSSAPSGDSLGAAVADSGAMDIDWGAMEEAAIDSAPLGVAEGAAAGDWHPASTVMATIAHGTSGLMASP